MKQEINYRSILDKIELPMIICNAHGKIHVYNKIAGELIKLLFEGSDLNESLCNAEQFFSLENVVNELLNSGLTSINKNFVLTRGSKKPIFFLLVILKIKGPQNKPGDFLVTITDITENWTFNNSFLEVAKNIESVIYSVTPAANKFLLLTESVQKIYGYTAAEIINNPRLVVKQIDSKDFLNLKAFLYELRQGRNSVFEYKIVNKNNETFYLRNSGFPVLQNGELIRIDGVISDITKEVTAKIELEKSEERYRLLIESANDLIFNLNNFGIFISVNTNGALTLGYNPKEMTGKHFLDFVSVNNKIDAVQAFRKILETETAVIFETVLISKLEEEVVYEIHCRPLVDDGKIIGVLGFGKNITEKRLIEEKQKQLYARLVEANRLISVERDRAKQQISVLEQVNKLKSEFISNISHELRTPLASIVGFAETISSDSELSKDLVIEFNEIILSESKRLAHLINDFLDFAKMEAGKMDLIKSDFDAVELLLSVIERLKQDADVKGVSVNTEIPVRPVKIYGDKERIEQVYKHLIANAIKFTEKDGRVSVFAQEFPKEFEVIITDTGIGISEKDLEKIFQKFFKVENPGTVNTGTGIGLGLIKQIVDLHGGLITVQSEENKGTTFVVKLPKNPN